MTEFNGVRAGYFRPKPVAKVGLRCPRCGSNRHVGRTTCTVVSLPYDWRRRLKPAGGEDA